MALSKTLQTFSQSNAWDDRYRLPLCRQLNNPWIYGAYALKVMRQAGLTEVEDLALCTGFEEHAENCRAQSGVPGLYDRWPGGGGGMNSHDELMGMAYISKDLARVILAYLLTTDGLYINKPDEVNLNDEIAVEKHNVYRFPFMKPFLMASAGYRVNLLSQAAFAGHLLLDAYRAAPGDTSDAGGRLRIWIMLEAMERFTLTKAAAGIWRAVMKSKGYRLNTMLALEPGNYCPVFGDQAKEEF